MDPFLPIKSCLSDMLVLALLSQKDMYGYEIIKSFDNFRNSLFYMDNQKIYTILHKLKAQGYITRYNVPAGEYRIRAYYHLETAGTQYLNFLLEEYDSIFEGANEFLKQTGVRK